MWKVHDGPIFMICVLKDGSIITGGGKDGRLVKFDSNMCSTGTANSKNSIIYIYPSLINLC